MSLFLGKSSSGGNLLHITSNTLERGVISEGNLLSTTIFNNKYPITTILYNTIVSVPGFSSPYEIAYTELPSSINSYLQSSQNYVFILIQGNDGIYRDCGTSGIFISLAGSSYYLANTNSSLAGNNALIVVTNTYTYPTGSIYISNQKIEIGSIDITTKKLLTIHKSGNSLYKVSYQLENSNILSLVDMNNAVSVGLDNKSIVYYDSTGNIYEVLSETASNRISSLYNGSVTGYIEPANATPYDGEAIVATLPSSIVSSDIRFLNITIPMSFYYAEGGSGGGNNWTGLLRLSTYTNKSFVIDALFFPFLRCRFEYNSSNRVVKARLYRETDQVESYYTGVSNPTINYYTL